MSRHQSPSPNNSAHMHNNNSNNGQQYQLHAVASSSSASKHQKPSKPFASGISASAEDVKYQTKYRELKRKVKEIELDNDKLYLKLLLAKKNIRRMNLERAILYERLAAVPPTPGRHPQDLPPEQDPVFAPQQPSQDITRGPDVNDHAVADYMHAHPNARRVRGPDGRTVAIEDTPPVDPRGPVALPGPLPPHGIPLVHNFQHESAPGFDPKRPLPALPPVAGIPPAHEYQQEPPLSNTRSAGGHHGPPPAWPQEQQPQPQPRPHSNNSSSSHHRDRSHHRHSRVPSSHGDLDPAQVEHNRLDTLPPVHRTRRTSVSDGQQGESRGRRHDLHDLTHQHGHGHAHPHIQVTPTSMPPSPPQQGHSPNSSRSSGRLHNHQRVGPGAHIHRERDSEYDRELYHAREMEREEERERARELSARMAMEEQELRGGGGGGPWSRDEPGLSGPGMPHGRSRSDTPVSGSGNDHSRPPSGQSYDRDRERERERERPSRAYGSRNLLGLDNEYAYDPRDDRGGHGPPRMSQAESSAGGGTMDSSRKRSRNDMEVDDDRDRERGGADPRYMVTESNPGIGSGSAATARMDEAYTAAKDSRDRGSKRMHHDDRDGQMSSVRDEGPMDQGD